MNKRDTVPGLAEKLKAARDAAGFTQVLASEASGVHHISIAKFETEVTTPTLKVLYKLAAAYGMGICELLPTDAEVAEKSKPKRARKPKKK